MNPGSLVAARTLLLVAGLWACGSDGGSDVTAPPQEFTLTVQSQGTGIGRVRTATGIAPTLDCAATPSVTPSTICTANYASGAAVTLTATPEGSSTFGGWSGDGATCQGTASCTLTMSQSLTAIVQFDVPQVPQARITTSTWRADPEFAGDCAVIWAVEVENTTGQTLELVRVDFNTRDNSGGIVSSSFTFLGPIPAGETRAAESFADYTGQEATAEFQITDIDVAGSDNPLAGIEIVSTNWRADPDFGFDGAIIWTVEVQNTTGQTAENVRIDFSTFDASGKIITATFTCIESIPTGTRRAAELLRLLRD